MGEVAGYGSGRGQGGGGVGLEELPRGEHRDTVLLGGGGWQGIVLSRGMGGSLGSKSCRRASAGRLFCVWGVGGWRRRHDTVLCGGERI